jgi:hypothetical protein
MEHMLEHPAELGERLAGLQHHIDRFGPWHRVGGFDDKDCETKPQGVVE